MAKVYGYCTACGEYGYRIPGHTHGDGQNDTDENPVWLLADVSDMTAEQIKEADSNKINCGCN